MENNNLDPKRLSELMNTVTVFNRTRYSRPDACWKITDVWTSGCDKDGNPVRVLKKPCVSMVPTILELMYKAVVAERNMNLQQIDKQVFDTVCDFLVNPRTKPSLLLMGPPGVGKTTFSEAAYRTIQYLYNDEINTYEISMKRHKASGLAKILKENEDEWNRIKGCTILYIDDFGFNGDREVANNYGVKMYPMQEIIEHRYDRQLMTILTTNLTLDGIRETYGARIHSRVCESFAIKAVTRDDFRISNTKK